MRLFAPDDPRPVHFMGVAGAGMSALAMVARRRGVPVTGCDRDTESGGAMASTDVRRLGGQVLSGHDPSHVEGARAVIVSSAVPSDHPELERARALGIPVVRRAEALAAAISPGLVVGVSGTHGKTTTTAMTTEALAASGLNPTGIAGGRVSGWGGNARIGGDDLFVVEADEYDKSFLALTPQVAVVNNVESDHLECYGSLPVLEEAYAAFARPARRVVAGAEDEGARRVAGLAGRPTWLVGLSPEADVRFRVLRRDVAATVAEVLLPTGQSVRLRLAVPGLHNLRNAAAALAVCVELGAEAGPALEALERFRGVGRRFELVGEAGGVAVVDDYAHHEAEIAATLEAARQAYPGRRLVAAFQPHLYSRTREHGVAMGGSLALADLAVVTDVYPAREQPIEGVSGRLVLQAVRDAGGRAEWVEGLEGMVGCLASLVRDGDVVVTMGAGDITRVGPELLGMLGGKVPA